MDSNSREAFRRKFLNIRSLNTSKFDQQLQTIKELYQGWRLFGELERLKSFLTEAARLCETHPDLPDLAIMKIQFPNWLFGGDGPKFECPELEPRLILQAIEAWERQDEFTPDDTSIRM